MSNLPSNLPEILRSYGLKVVTVPGWRTRQRPSSSGGFFPVGVLCHHTATSKKWLLTTVLRLLVHGREDLPGPLCQLGLGRDGTVYVIAAGRANHAGAAKASGTVAKGDGNRLYIGVEAFNDGVGEPWPKKQMDAYVLLAAVLSVRITRNSHETVRGHKETSLTGKIDPRFDMDDFREKVRAKMVQIQTPKDSGPNTRGENVDVALSRLEKARNYAVKKNYAGRVKQIQAAIAALNKIKPTKKQP